MVISHLTKKYNVQVPRYTSYPPFPFWKKDSLDQTIWENEMIKAFQHHNKLSIYIHIPFCESLCTYCGCNKYITKNHGVESGYISALITEWQRYLKLFSTKPKLYQLHLGGGTPTFLSPQNLDFLLNEILNHCEISHDCEKSIEIHPNYTTEEHIAVLSEHGFNRISLGVQDFDAKVQRAIHRMQNVETTVKVMKLLAKYNLNNINLDLVYGLPFQNLESLQFTLFQLAQLKATRIAFYSYAHVPWKSKAQRGFSEENLPNENMKIALFEFGKKFFLLNGYVQIGMDHFCLPSDELYLAYKEGKLHRNFMGYTTQKSSILLGLGASSISQTENIFIQNIKDFNRYQELVKLEQFEIENGHFLSNNEKVVQKHIMNIMCNFQTNIDLYISSIQYRFSEFEIEGLVSMDNQTIKVTEKGKPFVRNIAHCIDENFLHQSVSSQKVFSKAI